MTSSTRLIVSSVLLAVVWTVMMIWWTGTERANVLVLSLCGVGLGIGWYFVMRAYARRLEKRN